jgi:hypothetical protein
MRAWRSGTVRASNMRIVSARALHEKTRRASLSDVKKDVRLAYNLPRSVQRSTPVHLIKDDTRCQPELSRSDFVQLLKVGKDA